MGLRRSAEDDSVAERPIHRARTTKSLEALYRESCAIVLRHYRRRLTVAVIARALASSPRQVQRAFDEAGGTSFSAYLREVRLRNAAELIARQPLTVDRWRCSWATASRRTSPRRSGAASA
jgi:transcriptional regulator GlxA family with amidase domain